MNVGDLVKVPGSRTDHPRDTVNCGCYYCHNNGSGYGVVLNEEESDPGLWRVQFDDHVWSVWPSEVELVNESR